MLDLLLSWFKFELFPLLLCSSPLVCLVNHHFLSLCFLPAFFDCPVSFTCFLLVFPPLCISLRVFPSLFVSWSVFVLTFSPAFFACSCSV